MTTVIYNLGRVYSREDADFARPRVWKASVPRPPSRHSLNLSVARPGYNARDTSRQHRKIRKFEQYIALYLEILITYTSIANTKIYSTLPILPGSHLGSDPNLSSLAAEVDVDVCKRPGCALPVRDPIAIVEIPSGRLDRVRVTISITSHTISFAPVTLARASLQSCG